MSTENPPIEAAITPGAVDSSPSSASSKAANTPNSSSDAAQVPITELNLAKEPELDRDPTAVGRTVNAATSLYTEGGGRIVKPEDKVSEEPYNSDKSRDKTRQTITLWLIGLLCVIVGLTFVALFARGASSGFTDDKFFAELKQILDVIVGPVITLLASAVGFYFGYKQGELGEQARTNKSSAKNDK
jgi:hypothetical protein